MDNPKKPSGARRQRNRANTEAALIVAGRAAFSQVGYNASTTRAIAAEVGCSDALIQNYFGGKEGLLDAVLRAEGSVAVMVERFTARPAAVSLAAEVDATVRFVMATLQRGVANVRILMERALSDAEFKGRFLAATPREQICRGLAARLARDWPAVSNPVVAAELTVSLSFEFGFVHSELLCRDADETEQLVALTIPILVAGILSN